MIERAQNIKSTNNKREEDISVVNDILKKKKLLSAAELSKRTSIPKRTLQKIAFNLSHHKSPKINVGLSSKDIMIVKYNRTELNKLNNKKILPKYCFKLNTIKTINNFYKSLMAMSIVPQLGYNFTVGNQTLAKSYLWDSQKESLWTNAYSSGLYYKLKLIKNPKYRKQPYFCIQVKNIKENKIISRRITIAEIKDLLKYPVINAEELIDWQRIFNFLKYKKYDNQFILNVHKSLPQKHARFDKDGKKLYRGWTKKEVQHAITWVKKTK